MVIRTHTYRLSIFILISIFILSSCGGADSAPAPANTGTPAKTKPSLYQGSFVNAYTNGVQVRIEHGAQDSIPEIQITGAPEDTDYSRWSMAASDRNDYFALFTLKKNSSDTLYKFVFHRDTNSYEYSSPIVIQGLPADADITTFSTTSGLLYIQVRGNPRAFYDFEGSLTGGVEYRPGRFTYRGPVTIVAGPADTDYSRFAIGIKKLISYEGVTGTRRKIYWAFKQGSNTALYPFTYNPDTNAFEYLYLKSNLYTFGNIDSVTLDGAWPDDTSFKSFDMLFHGEFRFYLQSNFSQ